MNRRTLSKLLAAGALSTATRPLWASPAVPSYAPKFSVMLWTLQKQGTFDHALDIVAQAGYEGVELVGEFQHWSPAETTRIRSRLNSLGLTIDSMSGVKAGFAVPDQTAAFLTQFAAHLRSAQDLGCPQVILLSGPAVPTLSPAQQQQTAIDNLKRAADLAAGAKINIVIEPIDRLENPTIFLQSVAQAFPIARAVNRPNLKVLYDFFHEQRGSGNLLEKLDGNIDLIGLVHIADVPGRHQPGTGEINFSNLYRRLAELRYTGWIAMEFYPTADPVTTLRNARLQAISAFSA